MSIEIHQALYGEHNKGWDLLSTTLADNSLAKKISFKTDLQDSPPAGISWKPVIRGFLFNDHYLIIKTYLDTSKDVRNGRVFSHCLIISKKDIQKINDLGELFSVFNPEINKSISIQTLLVESDAKKNIDLSSSLSLRFNKAIKGFVAIENYNNTIIWVGQEDYEKVVCRFWQLLSFPQRASFNFGINFDPNEIPKDKINFIVIPENLEAKFDNKGYCIIRKNDSVTLTEFSEQFLARESNATTRLSGFINALDIKMDDLETKEISTLAKGINTYVNLITLKDLKLFYTLSNIVANYSPEAKQAVDLKNKLIEKVCAVLESVDKDEALLLKKFPLKSFNYSEKKITSSIKHWMGNYLFSEKENKTIDFTQLLTQIYDQKNSKNWLVKIFLEKVSNFLEDIDQKKVTIIWQWVINDAKILELISSSINNLKTTESVFISSFPSSLNDTSTLNLLKEFFIEKAWLRLHAIVVKLQYSLEIALIEQLKVDLEYNYFEGLEIILEDVKPVDIINLAVKNGDNRCISVAGWHCKKNSKLLEKLQIENIHWQRIWYSAIEHGNKVTDGIKEPKKIVYDLLDSLINGKKVSEELFEKISETEFTSLLDYPNRLKIWSKIPVKLRNNFLDKTSKELLNSLSKNSSFEIPIDNDLSNYLLLKGINEFLILHSKNIKNVLPILKAFTLPEKFIYDYVSGYNSKLDVIDAAQIGKLIFARRHYNTAFAIYQKATKTNNWKIALAECYTLLGLATQLSIAFWGIINDIEITSEQWWQATEDIIIDLYPNGNSITRVWKNAGGKEADLLINATAKEVWGDLISKIRKGTFKKSTMNDLLSEIKKNYYDTNEQFKLIFDLRKNYININ
ncbi:MAG: effector-associated domain EAD1-containing protein [Parachlamydiaceae bacterium]|nr:effector-associated domain EAD1-containing protein [Parachlamydiaceae bacterium]